MLIPSSPVMACLKNTLYGISKATSQVHFPIFSSKVSLPKLAQRFT